MVDPSPWSLAEVAALVARGGAGAVAREHLARRARSNFSEAWITTVERDELLGRAADIDARLAGGAALPLAGAPFAVKDNIDVAGVATTAGCRDFAYVPSRSAPAVEALQASGALFVGKTNLDQFATGLVGTRSPHYGPCRNPWQPAYVAGGSSSGSAVVVATGEVPLALGTDTAGSGRVPAANCGIVGVKPTPGIIATDGVVPAMPSFDCVSLFASTVADGHAGFAVLRGVPVVDGRAVRRVGVPRPITWYGDDDAAACFGDAVERISALGAEVVEIDGAPLWDAGALLYGSGLVAERAASFGTFVDAHPDAVHPATRAILEQAHAYSAVDVFAAMAGLRELRAMVEAWWGRIDAIVLPTVARVPTVDEAERELLAPSTELGRLTSFANPLGLPVVALPAGMRASGVPFGVSVAGPAGSEASLFALASAFAGEPALAAARTTAAGSRALSIAVVGAHLSGEPLNHQLVERGARLLRTTTTAPEYRLFALDTAPPKPGLVRAPGAGGAVEVEVWELDPAGFGSFVAAIPAPLGVGRIVLADGSEVSGFLSEPYAVEGMRDITAFGGWRAFLTG